MWQILMRMALPALIKALEGRIGKEAMDVMRASVLAAAATGFGGDEKRAIVWSRCVIEWQERGLAIAEELPAAGVPWFANLAMEALVALARLEANKAERSTQAARPALQLQAAVDEIYLANDWEVL